MNKIPKAEEFIKSYELGNTGKVDIEDATEAIIEFAKLHIKAYKKAVTENIIYSELSVDWETFNKSGCLYLDEDGKKEFNKSIKNAYPLSNIK